jgi:GNAT superfamily N-acetyltransferase
VGGGVRVAAVTEAHLAGLRGLFEASSSTCFCRYWHFTGTKNEWLDRCAHRPEENARELEDAVRAGRDDGGGLVALDDGGRVVGWMKLVRRASVPKLRALPVYRNLALGDESSTFSVGCFLVHPEHRHQGVARALLAGAEAIARARCVRSRGLSQAFERTSLRRRGLAGPRGRVP